MAGLGVSLGLARAGREVVVFDRDPLTAAADPDEAFLVPRQGAPQVRHTHGLLARLTGTLRDRYPDVLDALVGTGGVQVDLTQRFDTREPGDEDLRVLLARRTTLEWALRRAAAAEPGVVLRGETPVAGLLGHPGNPATVTGVRLESGEEMAAATTIAAGGRRGGSPGWLEPFGVDIPEEEHDTGIVYLTRWYRTTEAWDRVMGGEDLVKLGGDMGYLFYLAVPADRGAFSLTMAVLANDTELRSRLLKPEAFQRAAAVLPLPPGLLDSLVADGPVHPMGSLVNRIRRFLAPDGAPLVTGYHAIGDAHTCTNPIYGRGCSLALAQSVFLVDALTQHAGDPAAQVAAYEARCRAETEPWYQVAVQTDAGRRARAKASVEGHDPGANPMEQLFAFGAEDPVIGRAILRAVNLLATPQELMADTELMGRAMQLAAQRNPAPDVDDPAAAEPAPNRWAREGPTHQEMLDLTDAA